MWRGLRGYAVEELRCGEGDQGCWTVCRGCCQGSCRLSCLQRHALQQGESGGAMQTAQEGSWWGCSATVQGLSVHGVAFLLDMCSEQQALQPPHVARGSMRSDTRVGAEVEAGYRWATVVRTREKRSEKHDTLATMSPCHTPGTSRRPRC